MDPKWDSVAQINRLTLSLPFQMRLMQQLVNYVLPTRSTGGNLEAKGGVVAEIGRLQNNCDMAKKRRKHMHINIKSKNKGNSTIFVSRSRSVSSRPFASPFSLSSAEAASASISGLGRWTFFSPRQGHHHSASLSISSTSRGFGAISS